MTGLATALRLGVRLNYRGLVAAVLALIVAMYAGTLGIGSLYPTALDRMTYSSIANTLTSQHALQGPPTALNTTGGITVFEVGWYLTIAVALLNIVLVVRNTRAQEAAGRLELLRAGRFDVHANSLAVLGLALVVNALLAAGLAAGMVAAGTEAAGALIFGLSAAAIGLVFAALALLAAQFTEHAKGAYGIACAALGVSYLARALGDTVDSDVLRYLSPLGLAQAAHPYGVTRWWPLLACLAVTVLAAALALRLEHVRDYDAGLLRPATGSASASRFTRTVPGLVTRTQRATVLMWAAGLFGIGAGFGAAAKDAGEVAAGTQGMLNLLAGFNVDVVDGFLAMAVLLLSLAASGAVISLLSALRAEEVSGRADLMLSGTLSKTRLALTHLGITAGAAVLMAVATGLGIGLGHTARTGELHQIPRLIAACLGQLPALALFGGLTVAVIGLTPRVSWLPWVLLAGSAVVSILGPSMDLPSAAMNLSVFDHVPHLPGTTVDALAVTVLSLIAVALGVAGVLAFTRRDLE